MAIVELHIEVIETQEDVVKSSTKDQIQGKLLAFKGKAKEEIGKVTNNPNLAAEGEEEQLAGKIQEKVAQIKKVYEK